jgi:hypothetical protein
MWLRVFCLTTPEIPPARIASTLHEAGFDVQPHFKGDDLGWTTGELILGDESSPIGLARFLTKEDKLRDDLNSYAAELETATHSPYAAGLMERVIQTAQLITLRKPVSHSNDAQLDRACEYLVQFLARESEGFYQIDLQGWFESSGELLVEEF